MCHEWDRNLQQTTNDGVMNRPGPHLRPEGEKQGAYVEFGRFGGYSSTQEEVRLSQARLGLTNPDRSRRAE